MRSGPSRLVVFSVAVFICIGLIAVSVTGLLSPFESLVSVPFSILQGASSGASRRVSQLVGNVSDIQSLQKRNADLERALVNFQAEIVELREIKADYARLAPLVNFAGMNPDRQYLAATVIARDTTGLLRSITIDRGSRDGIIVGMPVVTELGLIGRVYKVAAANAQVQLVTDMNSYVNARMQTSRGEGSIVGTASGDLRMTFIPLNDEVKDGDSVVTSGIGGKFPRGILIGQVKHTRLDDTKLFQEAQVQSLVDFSRLEIVLVITSFQPADLSAFATPTPAPGQPAQ
ncbi:MAG: rod shape-determining protein MreC [Anaerolineae bacterium]|nr:rod shape-determining protein MreC [Anaerolineae bacterium]